MVRNPQPVVPGQPGVPGFSGTTPGEEQSVRRRILEAMVSTVAERGYQDTEVVDVIGRAGVSPGAFAELYSDKEECFVEAMDDAVASLEREVVRACAGVSSWPDRVRVGLRAFLSVVEANPARARLAMVESSQAGPAATERFRRAFQLFVPYFDEGRQQVGHDLPAPMSDAVVGGIALTVQRRVADGDGSDGVGDLLPDLVYFALVPYLGHRRAYALAAS